MLNGALCDWHRLIWTASICGISPFARQQYLTLSHQVLVMRRSRTDRSSAGRTGASGWCPPSGTGTCSDFLPVGRKPVANQKAAVLSALWMFYRSSSGTAPMTPALAKAKKAATVKARWSKPKWPGRTDCKSQAKSPSNFDRGCQHQSDHGETDDDLAGVAYSRFS